MEKDMTIFQECRLLESLSENDLTKYLATGLMYTTNYGKNEILHFEGDHCTHLEVILAGKVAVERIGEDGRLLTVTDFSDNNSIGANLLYSSHPYYPMTVTAKEATNILVIKEALVFELCTSNPKFLSLFLSIISDHTIRLGNKIKHHVSRSIREGLLTYINKQITLQGSKTVLLTLSKKALAEEMGISRTSLSRELTKMKNDGLIDYTNKTITLF